MLLKYSAQPSVTERFIRATRFEGLAGKVGALRQESRFHGVLSY